MTVYGATALVAGSAGQPQPDIVTANVSAHQPLPASFSDPLYVVEPWAPDHYRKITRWIGIGMPSHGQPCTLIQQSENGQRIWVAIVFPQTS
ncbi:MAG: hypothetical protein WB562_10665 [Candidatus Sulfotelmatobacter sp.]